MALLQFTPEDPDTALRRALWEAGYQPVAVYTGQKKPIGVGWQKMSGVPRLSANARNTGILCDAVRAVDIDIDDPDRAAAAISIVERVLGPTPLHRIREGSARQALLYRGRGKKRIIKLGEDKVEILGEGNQFVAYGAHPDGGVYGWEDVEPTEWPLEELQEIGAADEERLAAALAEALGGHPETAPPPSVSLDPPLCPSRTRASDPMSSAPWLRKSQMSLSAGRAVGMSLLTLQRLSSVSSSARVGSTRAT